MQSPEGLEDTPFLLSKSCYVIFHLREMVVFVGKIGAFLFCFICKGRWIVLQLMYYTLLYMRVASKLEVVCNHYYG